jgi:hypothetical protein
MARTGMVGHAVEALAHPIALVAAAVLAANALWWQRAFPSWWTGKIGDVAWLAVAPLLAGLGLAVVKEGMGVWGPLGTAGHGGAGARRVGLAALALTGAAFVLVKTVPAANALVVQAFAAAGVHAKLALDPTDLLALPGLGLAWAAWSAARGRVGQWAGERVRFVWRLAAVGLAAGAVLADSAAPTPFGVACVGQGGFTLYAVQEWSAVGYVGARARQEVFTSADGGATWMHFDSGQYDPDEGRGLRHWCTEPAWPLTDPNEAAREFWFVEGAGIYVTMDGGQTLALERASEGLPSGAPSAVFDQETGNLVVAAGGAGVLVRAPEGEWTTIAVGP